MTGLRLQPASHERGPIPVRAGIGLRAGHHDAFIASRPPVGWVEVHSENFFVAGGPSLALLESVREQYPVSLHGVGLSLGSADPVDSSHLEKLRRLAARFQPGFVSEHLCWGSIDGRHLNDLLPLPYTDESLAWLAGRVVDVQNYLDRRILIENVSTYLAFAHSTIPEWEFMNALAATSGCGLLLDVNNVYVSARNLGFDPRRYIDGIDPDAVQELHLAGHSVQQYAGKDILVDTHDRPVCADVWRLYDYALRRIGLTPTLVEWDSDLPSLDTLCDEAAKAESRMRRCHDLAA